MAIETRDLAEFERSKTAIKEAIRRQGLACTEESIDLMAYKLAIELIALPAWPLRP